MKYVKNYSTYWKHCQEGNIPLNSISENKKDLSDLIFHTEKLEKKGNLNAKQIKQKIHSNARINEIENKKQ